MSGNMPKIFSDGPPTFVKGADADTVLALAKTLTQALEPFSVTAGNTAMLFVLGRSLILNRPDASPEEHARFMYQQILGIVANPLIHHATFANVGTHGLNTY